MSTISEILSAPPDNFSTTLSGNISSSALTIPLNSVTGLGTEGVGVIYQKDSDGNPVTSTIEFIHWTGVSSLNLTLTDTGDRGITGSASGAQAHSSGDTFEVWIHSAYYPLNAVTLTGTQILEHKTLTSPVINTPTGDVATKTGIEILANKTLASPVVRDWDGWEDANETWTYASADDPTFTFTIPGDLTSKYSVGMRIKLTQTTIKYFIITAVSYSSPNTTVTVYGGTDYDLVNAAITSPYYSTQKAPQGFPLDPLKWTVQTTVTTNVIQATPTAGVWYNPSSTSISIPIGAWNLSYQANIHVEGASTTSVNVSSALSTASDSASDNDLRSYHRIEGASGNITFDSLVHRSKYVAVASKTPYYLNVSTGSSGMGSIGYYGAVNSTIVRAVCAYL